MLFVGRSSCAFAFIEYEKLERSDHTRTNTYISSKTLWYDGFNPRWRGAALLYSTGPTLVFPLKSQGTESAVQAERAHEVVAEEMTCNILPCLNLDANMGVPSGQRAAVTQGHGHDATPVKKVPLSQDLGPGQILIRADWTGLGAPDNKSPLHDEWQAFGIRMMNQINGIAGHEGAGEVVGIHPYMSELWKVGDRAGVK